MKRVGMLVVVVLSLLFFTGFALGQDQPQAKEQKATPYQAMGQVVSVDAAKKMLVVKSKDKEMTFETSDKAASTLANLKTGDEVRQDNLR